MIKASFVKKELQKIANPQKAKNLERFFQTKKGQYGYGDVFWGISVPGQRKIAKKYQDISLSEIVKLLSDKIHECRFCALILLVDKYKKGEQQEVIEIYFNNLQYINNWDLVDLSAPYILGDFFLNKDKKIIKQLAKSSNLWKKRIAMVSTLGFIKNNKLNTTFELAKLFLKDDHHLMHKATGWMLREAGKKDEARLKDFLDLYASKMPRIMLSYAIEKFNQKERQYFLKKT